MENDEVIFELSKINSRISTLETHIVNLIIPIQSVTDVSRLLQRGIQIDDRHLMDQIKNFRNCIDRLIDFMKGTDLSKISQILIPLIEEFQNLNQTLGEIKYIGKRLNDIEKSLDKIKEKGIKKQINLEFSCDGYDLVPRPVNYDKEEPKENRHQNLENLLNKFTTKEAQILIHRLGLCNQKKKKFTKIGDMFGVTRETIRRSYVKIIRKLRNPCIKNLVKSCGYEVLIKEVFA